MNITYKKLFDITYNNKIFTIFIDNHNRRTFLQKDQKGEYIYPTLEDFKILNHIYNIHNPFLSSDLKDYFFKEKIRFASGVLALTVVTSSLSNTLEEIFKNYQVEITEEEITLIEEDTTPELQFINDLKELDNILGYTDISKEQVILAIESNNNISNYYKEIMKNLINKVCEEYPNIDLRVFYKNIKTLKINELTEQDFHSQFSEFTVANYDSVTNTVNLSPNVSLKTLYHEFAHVMWTFYWPDLGIYRVSRYRALNEAMTNKVSYMLSSEINTYINEGLILDYFMTYTDFTYEDYMRYGIDKLIEQLKEKYSSIDFNYICSAIDSMKDSYTNLGVTIPLSSSEGLLEELFSLALLKINPEHPYESFINFALLLDQNNILFEEYLNKYNSRLTQLGYSTISKEELNKMTEPYQDFSYIIGTEEQIYIGKIIPNQMNKYIILDNNKEKEIDFSNIDMIRSFSNFSYQLSLAYLQYSNIFGTNEFWQKTIKDYGNISDADYKSVPIYLNNKLLIEENPSNLYIQIGKNAQDQVGFLITDKDQKIIYKTDKSLLHLSNYVTLYSYMKEYQITDKIELSYILNNSYLLEVSSSFRNLEIEGKEIKVTPLYIMTIIDDYRGGKGYLSDFKVMKTDYGTKLSPALIFLDIEIDEDISLYTILNYYHLINEEQTEYSLTIPEITNLITNYVNEQKEIKAR